MIQVTCGRRRSCCLRRAAELEAHMLHMPAASAGKVCSESAEQCASCLLVQTGGRL